MYCELCFCKTKHLKPIKVKHEEICGKVGRLLLAHWTKWICMQCEKILAVEEKLQLELEEQYFSSGNQDSYNFFEDELSTDEETELLWTSGSQQASTTSESIDYISNAQREHNYSKKLKKERKSDVISQKEFTENRSTENSSAEKLMEAQEHFSADSQTIENNQHRTKEEAEENMLTQLSDSDAVEQQHSVLDSTLVEPGVEELIVQALTTDEQECKSYQILSINKTQQSDGSLATDIIIHMDNNGPQSPDKECISLNETAKQNSCELKDKVKFNFINTFQTMANYYICNFCNKSKKYKLKSTIKKHIKYDHFGYQCFAKSLS